MTAAVKPVLIDIGRILGSSESKFMIIGSAFRWLQLGEDEIWHGGTMDVVFGLDPAVPGDVECAQTVEALVEHGYLPRKNLGRYLLVRNVPPTTTGPPSKSSIS